MDSALRIRGNIERPSPVPFTVDGATIEGVPGESVAAALLAAGIRLLRRSPRSQGARGMFCMMGICQECVVRIDGRFVAACLEPVRVGMKIDLDSQSRGRRPE